MKKGLKIVGFTLLGLIVLGTIAGDPEETAKQADEPKTVEVEEVVTDAPEKEAKEVEEVESEGLKIETRVEPNNYAFLKDAYMSGCTSNYEDCKCMFDHMYNNLGEASFMQMSLEVEETGQLTDEMWEAILACV